MENSQFEQGKGYWATSTLDRKNQVVVVALKDAEGMPVFARLREFGRVKSMMRMDGREFAQVEFDDGVYCVTSTVPAEVGEANRVMSAVLGRRARGGASACLPTDMTAGV